MQRRKVVGAVAAAVVALGGVLLAATAVQADPAPTPTVINDNVSTCSGGQHPAGLDGEILFSDEAGGPAGSGTVTGGDTLDVTINVGWTATGIVVKGGSAAHVYTGPFVGLVTIDDMVSPPVGKDNTPQISHWFVCGFPTTPSTPVTSTTTTTTTSTEPPGTTSVPGTTPGDEDDDEDLPVTGVALTSMVIAGLALVGGGAALLIARRRRDLQNPIEL
jgi:LPXTG-motif cell wall-anchored protein